MRRFTTIAALGAAAALMTAGTASASTHPAPKATGNIVQVASSAPQFSTLVTLIKKAGLVKTLSGKGPFTVMAPTNAAFAKVPKATLDAIAADKQKLTQVLTYHVIGGNVPASKVVSADGTEIKTLEGGKIAIKVMDGKVYLNGSTRVTKTDIKASNGVVHQINGVLLPPNLG